MAKRRFNKKFGGFLLGGIAAVVALCVGYYLVRSRLFKEKPDKYVALGRQALQHNDYVAARENLARAAALSPPDPTLYTMLGVALNGLTSKEPDNVNAARQQWEQALGIEPGYIPAYEHLIQFWRDELDLRIRASLRAQAAEQLRKMADRMLTFDSNNHIAKTAKGEAIIESLLDGIQLKDSLKLAQDLLVEAQREEPDDAEIPYSLSRSMVWQAQEAGRSNDSTGQARAYNAAVKMMTDALTQRPQNAYMHYRLGQLYLQLVSSKRSGTEFSAEVKDLVNKALVEVDTARKLAQPGDPHFIDINLYDARLVLERPSYSQQSGPDPNRPVVPVADAAAVTTPGQLDRVKVAESIYRDVLKVRPDEPVTTISLAGLLGVLPGRRDEAIALLSKKFVDPNPPPGIKGTLLPHYQNDANVKLLGMKLDELEVTREKAKQDSLLSESDQLCQLVYGTSPEAPNVLAMKGRLELARHHIVEATQTLRRAITLMDAHDPMIERTRYEVMYYLARAYVSAQQTGEAKKLLKEITGVYDHFVPAQVLLARLLIIEHDNEGAKPHVEFLEQILPQNPNLLNDVVRMRIAMADGADKDAVVKKYYDMSPETNSTERRDKAATARLAGFNDEAVRLYADVHKELPGDEDAATNLAGLYLATNQPEKAAAVVNESLVASPLNSTLLALRMQLNGKSANPAVGDVRGAAAIAATQHELDGAEAARIAGDVTGREQHIAAAEKLKPDDARVWDAAFMLALDEHGWDRAGTYLEKLATANSDHAGGLMYRWRYAMARSELSRASDLALQLTREKPEFSQSWCLLGQVQKAQGRYDDALANFKIAQEKQTQNVDAHVGLIECAYAMGDKDAAHLYITNARRVMPGNDIFREYELRHELQYGDPQKVIEPRLAAVRSAPDSVRNWINLGNAYLAAAKARDVAKDSAAATAFNSKARDVLLQAVTRFPDDDDVSTTCSKAALAINDFPGAQKVMTDLVGRPTHKGKPTSAMTLSDFYNAAGRADLSISTLQDYLKHVYVPSDHNNDLNVQLRLATLLEKANRIDDALAALSANSSDPSILRMKVGILINANRMAEADKVLNDAAAAAPLTLELLNLKGIAALSQNRLGDAKAAFDKVLASDPANLAALTQRAQTLLRMSNPDYAGAVADLSRARDLSSADMEIRIQIADADRRQGKVDDAVRELESALRVVPSSKRVRLYLVEVYANTKPPKWGDAERVLRDGHQIQKLVSDADLLHAEAMVAMGQNQLSRAQELIRSAMTADPQNLRIVRTFYDILVKSKMFTQLIDHSDQLLAANKNAAGLWWVYPYRAIARTRGMNDRATAGLEYQQGLASAAALHDDNATGQIMRSLATELGNDQALRTASAQAAKDDHWRIIAAALCRQKGDHNGAVNWIEQVLAPDQLAKLSPADQDAALRLAAVEYQEQSPPNVIKAVDAYRELLKRSADDLSILNNLACLLIDQTSSAFDPRGALKYAEQAYNQANASGVDEPSILDTYGWTLIVNGQNDAGVEKLEDALKKRDLPEAHYHKAKGLLMRDPPDPEQARLEFSKALQDMTQMTNESKPVDQNLLQKVQAEYDKLKRGIAG